MIPTTESPARRPIRYVSLNWTIKPLAEERRAKLGLGAARQRVRDPEHEFVLEHYEQYNELHRCDLCNSNEKAHHVVRLRDPITNETFHSGLNCLHNNFGISVKDIEAVSGVQLAFLERLRDLHHGEVNTTLEGVALLRDTLTGFGDGPALRDAVRRVERILADPARFGRGTFNDEFTVLSKMMLLHSEREREPALYRARWTALRHHPLLGGEDLTCVDLALGDARKYLFYEHAERLFQLLARVDGREVSYRGALKPWAYPSRDAYVAALRAVYVQRADEGSLEPGVFVSKGTALTYYIRDIADTDHVLGVSAFEVVPKLFASDANLERLKKQYTGLEAHLSKNEHRFRDRRKTIDCQILVIWMPNRWTQTYGFWHDFGRERLERL